MIQLTQGDFRVYAIYKVQDRLTDKKVHAIIDGLNPNLRASEVRDGKKHIREEAYSIVENIASINGLQRTRNFSKQKRPEKKTNHLKTTVRFYCCTLCLIA